MRKVKNKPSGLGAAADRPEELISRAIREWNFATGKRRTDVTAQRMAAVTGWLAISSLADVVAAELKLPSPGGANGRREVFRTLEQRAKARPGTFVADFESARALLHGGCSHGDAYQPRVGDILDGLRVTIDDGLAAIRKAKRGRK